MTKKLLTFSFFSALCWLIPPATFAMGSQEQLLFTAASQGNIGAINKILTHQPPVKINARNKQGETALHLAVKNKNVTIVQLLLDAGADFSQKNGAGKTIFDLTLTLEIEEVLLKAFNLRMEREREETRQLIAIAERLSTSSFPRHPQHLKKAKELEKELKEAMEDMNDDQSGTHSITMARTQKK